MCAGIADLADEYLTDALSDALPVMRRVRLTLAQRGAVDELIAAIEAEEENGAPPFHLEDGRAFARYPGFRDPALNIPDRVFEVIGESVPAQLASGRSWSRPSGSRTATISRWPSRYGSG